MTNGGSHGISKSGMIGVGGGLNLATQVHPGRPIHPHSRLGHAPCVRRGGENCDYSIAPFNCGGELFIPGMRRAKVVGITPDREAGIL